MRWRSSAGDMHVAARKCRQHGRKLDTKYRAALLPVVAKNLAGMLLNNPKADAQAQAGALPNWLGSVERIEHPVGLLDAGPIVAEQSDDIAAIATRLDGKNPIS
jgi:hypothetical protein